MAVEEEEETRDDNWRQFLEEGSSEGNDSGSCSGEDSDEAEPAQQSANTDRRKSDMAMLAEFQQRNSLRAPSTATSSSKIIQGGEEEDADQPNREEKDGSHSTPEKKASESPTKADGTPGSTAGRRTSFISRLSQSFHTLAGKASAEEAEDVPTGEGLAALLKEEADRQYDDAWYQRWSLRLSKDGLACTKVATNGKPYERRLHVDSRNLTIEIRGGRAGATGVLLDDLVDLRRGLHSQEFEKFQARFKRDIVPPELSRGAAVFKTPSRTFSFLFSSEVQRDTVCHFVVYLLRSKNRGMMAAGPASKNEQAPKQGHGKASYSNRSAYEGEFQNYMRNGHGTLTLSDGTKYECDWKNDERHGKGKEFWADGTVFAGVYVKGMRSGLGVMTWPEGSKYSGQFERGRANGEGELVRTDGSVYKGIFLEDCMSGEGKMRWKDGVEYSGEFVANRREGFGKMAWTSGRWKSYEGHWKDGVQHGHGTLIDRNDSEFSGTFAAGKLEKWDDDVAT